MNVLETLQVTKVGLAPYGVRSLLLFGSTAREEAGPSSDVDLLVEFEGTPSFDRYMGLRMYLEDQLGRPVDLITRSGVREQLLPHILKDAVRVA